MKLKLEVLASFTFALTV